MRDRLDDLRELLLRGGTSPACVGRYLRELSEHREDLYDDLLAQGMVAEAAWSEADRRLGDTDALMLPMLADRRFRSHAARWPVLFYLVLPLVSLLAFAVGSVLVLALLASTPLRPFMPDLGQGAALLWLAAPVVIAWLTILSALRRRADLHWPALSCLAAVALATAMQLQVELPSGAGAGEIGVSLTPPALLPVILLATLALFPLLLRKTHG